MTRDEFCSQKPFSVPQDEKEAFFAKTIQELTAYHRTHCKPYDRICRNLSQEAPYLPVSLFKLSLIHIYSKNVRTATDAGGAGGFQADVKEDGSWLGQPLSFPRIQGADSCGRIVAVGAGVDESRIGERAVSYTHLSSSQIGMDFSIHCFRIA